MAVAVASVAFSCWVPILLSVTRSLFSTARPHYRSSPTMPWTRRIPEILNAGGVSLSGTSCCLEP